MVTLSRRGSFVRSGYDVQEEFHYLYKVSIQFPVDAIRAPGDVGGELLPPPPSPPTARHCTLLENTWEIKSSE